MMGYLSHFTEDCKFCDLTFDQNKFKFCITVPSFIEDFQIFEIGAILQKYLSSDCDMLQHEFRDSLKFSPIEPKTLKWFSLLFLYFRFPIAYHQNCSKLKKMSVGHSLPMEGKQNAFIGNEN